MVPISTVCPKEPDWQRGALRMCERPGIRQFADGFETVNRVRLTDGLLSDDPDRSRWNHAWDHAWGSCAIERDRAIVRSGKQCVAMSLPAAGSIGLSKHLGNGQDRIHLRYYVRYARDFPGARLVR